ncbi:hypothetical protein DLJ59_06340 [Micromonospora inaquosa]|uniref:AAA+ ATPase domain-containing protein n=2 Tax=Micromonospora inaquosa TaxID=2203716 RepID=A0A3N9WYU6_9ACTN|nr:hypothetical protein DLJ59_06340 [Micromonospora inaquosa]
MLQRLGVAATDVNAWLEALERVRSVPGPRPYDSPAPYRGLRPYRPTDADLFAGRTALVEELVTRVRDSAGAGQVTVVVGPSGSGKTSLLWAGLAPALVGVNDLSPVFGMVPGEKPLAQLTAGLKELADRRSSASNGQQPSVIIIDQAEQLFVACKDPDAQNGFLCALTDTARSGATGDGSAGTVVVLALRSDFYTRALTFPVLRGALQRSQVVVGPMSDTEVRQAVTEPATRRGFTLQSGLVDLILRDLTPVRSRTAKDAAHEAGSLPLLSHALLMTWQIANSRTLTVDHYRASGGIDGAVTKTAEDTYLALGTTERKERARRIFLRLAQCSDEQIYTRRRVPWAEILDRDSHGHDADEDEQYEVLDLFIDARLLTADEDHVEIAHEALLPAWPRLKEWLDGDQGWQRQHQRLRTAATHWADSGRSTDGLLRGEVLQTTRGWVQEHGRDRDLSRLERQFLDDSVEQQAAEDQLARRHTRRRYQLITLAVVFAVIAASVALVARHQRVAAARQQQIAAVAQAQALSRLIADRADRLREQDPALALQLSLTAFQTAETPEARSSLLNATSSPVGTRLRLAGGKTRSLAVSPTGQIAAGTDDGAVQLWTLAADGTPRPDGTVAGSTQPLIKLVFSSDGRHMAGADGKGAVLLWDLVDLSRPPTTLGQMAKPATALAWDEVGQRAFVGSDSGITVMAVGSATATPMAGAGSKPIKAIAVSPDGRTMAAGGVDTNVYRWDITNHSTAAQLSTLTEANSQIFSLAFSPDSTNLLAGTGAEHNVHRWNVRDPTRPEVVGAPLEGPLSWVNYVSFSPDGAVVTAASSDRMLWTFDARTGRSAGLLPHPSPLITAVFTPDGRVVTLASDGIVRTWSVPGPIISGAEDSVFALSFTANGVKLGIAAGAADNSLRVWSAVNPHRPRPQGPPLTNSTGQARLSGSGVITPDGATIASGTIDGTLVRWNISDAANARPLPPLRIADDLIEAISVSADGRFLAASCDDGTVRIVGLGTDGEAEVEATLRSPEQGLIYQAAFSPDGKLVAAASVNNNVYLWNIENKQDPVLLATLSGLPSSALSVAFSPDGKLVAAGDTDGMVRLWNVVDPRRPSLVGAPLTGSVGYLYTMAFRPNSRLLATGSTDGTIWLWDLTDPTRPEHLATLTGPDRAVLTVAIDPTTGLIAAAGEGRTVRLWATDPATAASWVCATTGVAITQDEWSQYLPELPFAPPCD